jgi:hypothetical protein
MEHNSKAAQRQNAALLAENASLRQAMLKRSCFTCGGATVPAELLAENHRLLMENARLRGDYMRATELLNQIVLQHSAAPGPAVQRPPAVVFRRPGAVVLPVDEGASKQADRDTRLRRHAEAAMDQFVMLATSGEPLWLPTPDGEALSYLGYQKKATLPMHHGGLIMEATRETGIVRAFVADLIVKLTDAVRACVHTCCTHIFTIYPIHAINPAAYTIAWLNMHLIKVPFINLVLVFCVCLSIDQKRWCEMFPDVVASVTTNGAITAGDFGSCIQLVCVRFASMHIPFRRCIYVLFGHSTNIVNRSTDRSSTCR